jgi:hypothetical protein
MGETEEPAQLSSVPPQLPALYQHCCDVFDTMKKAAQPAEYEGRQILMYEGHTTKMFEDLRLSVPYYSSVMTALKTMGCVIQLQRGGGGSKSKWAILTRPTEEGFFAYKGKRQTKASKEDQWRQSMVQMLNDLRNRVDYLERNTGIGKDKVVNL